MILEFFCFIFVVSSPCEIGIFLFFLAPCEIGFFSVIFLPLASLVDCDEKRNENTPSFGADWLVTSHAANSAILMSPTAGRRSFAGFVLVHDFSFFFAMRLYTYMSHCRGGFGYLMMAGDETQQ